VVCLYSDCEWAVRPVAQSINNAVPAMAVTNELRLCKIEYQYRSREGVVKQGSMTGSFIERDGKKLVQSKKHGLLRACTAVTIRYGKKFAKVAVLPPHPLGTGTAHGAYIEDLRDHAFWPAPDDVDTMQIGNVKDAADKQDPVTAIRVIGNKIEQKTVPMLGEKNQMAINADGDIVVIKTVISYRPDSVAGDSGMPVMDKSGKCIGSHSGSPGNGPFKPGQEAYFEPWDFEMLNKAFQTKNNSVPTSKTTQSGSGTVSQATAATAQQSLESKRKTKGN